MPACLILIGHSRCSLYKASLAAACSGERTRDYIFKAIQTLLNDVAVNVEHGSVDHAMTESPIGASLPDHRHEPDGTDHRVNDSAKDKGTGECTCDDDVLDTLIDTLGGSFDHAEQECLEHETTMPSTGDSCRKIGPA